MIILPVQLHDVPRVLAAADADRHPAFAPTHFMQNDAGEVTGYFSAGQFTPLFFWSKTGNREIASLKFAKAALAEAKKLGRAVLLPCSASSPFVPLLPGFGFKKIGSADFWLAGFALCLLPFAL